MTVSARPALCVPLRAAIVTSGEGDPARELTVRIIPCLDVKDGEVVKGVRFQNLRQAGDPARRAALYESEGADEIVFLDISATPEGRETMLDVVHATASQVFVPLTVGGGIRSPEDAAEKIKAGAAVVVTGNILESSAEKDLMKKFSDAVHA